MWNIDNLKVNNTGDEPVPISIADKVDVKDYLIQHAIDVIYATYGDTVSVEAKNKDLLKFGRNRGVQTTKTTIMTLPSGIYNETYVSTNVIDSLSSSSAADTMSVIVEGHTISDGNFTFVTQTVTLTGQTRLVLPTPLARLNRIKNNGATDMVGTIYGYENTPIVAGVPTDGTKVHCMIYAGFNNSEKASTTISNTDYWLISNFYGDCLEKVATWCLVHLEVRLQDKVFTNVVDKATSDVFGFTYESRPYIIVPKNSDVRLRATASANDKDVSGGINGILLKVI